MVRLAPAGPAMPIVPPTLFSFRPPIHVPGRESKVGAPEAGWPLGTVPGGQGGKPDELVIFGDISTAGTHSTPAIPAKGHALRSRAIRKR